MEKRKLHSIAFSKKKKSKAIKNYLHKELPPHEVNNEGYGFRLFR